VAVRIGLLTGGGDCPGLNAAIRAVARIGRESGDEVIGFRHGWRGVVEGECAALTSQETKGILQSGGTILRTARYHPDEHEGASEAVEATFARERLDCLIVVGGDGTLGAAALLAVRGIPIVGIPKTIDNDVRGTERCIGFATAVATAAEAVDRVHTTGESHDRLMVVEVMGRATGWLAVCSGVAAGADAICIPEETTSLDDLASALRRRHDAGSSSSVVVVAEGARIADADAEAVGTTGGVVADALRRRTGFEVRLTILGHIQRGGSPVAADRLLATALGVAAVDAVHDGCTGTLMAVAGEDTVRIPLGAVRSGPRPVPPTMLAVARRMMVRR